MKNGVPTVCVPMPDRRVPEALPRHGRRQRRRAARRGQRHGRRRRREDGRVHHAGGERQEGVRRRHHTVDNPECSNSATPDVMGYHTAAEIPNYWTYAKDFVLDDHMFEPVASWSLPDHLYLVSGWSAKCSSPAPSSCVNDITGPLHAGPDAEVRRPGHRHRHRRHHQRLDRHHLAPLQQARLVGLLRADRRPARLRQRLGRGLPAGGAELSHPGHLEPAARLRGRAEGPPDPQHPAAEQLLRRGQEGDPALGHVGHPVPGRQRAPAGQRPPGPGLRHRSDQRGHEEPRLGLDRHLLAVGRLGRLLRQRRAARRSTRTATACGSRPW